MADVGRDGKFIVPGFGEHVDHPEVLEYVKALGINPHGVTRVIIDMPVNTVAQLYVQRHVEVGQLKIAPTLGGGLEVIEVGGKANGGTAGMPAIVDGEVVNDVQLPT